MSSFEKEFPVSCFCKLHPAKSGSFSSEVLYPAYFLLFEFSYYSSVIGEPFFESDNKRFLIEKSNNILYFIFYSLKQTNGSWNGFQHWARKVISGVSKSWEPFVLCHSRILCSLRGLLKSHDLECLNVSAFQSFLKINWNGEWTVPTDITFIFFGSLLHCQLLVHVDFD